MALIGATVPAWTQDRNYFTSRDLALKESGSSGVPKYFTNDSISARLILAPLATFSYKLLLNHIIGRKELKPNVPIFVKPWGKEEDEDSLNGNIWKEASLFAKNLNACRKEQTFCDSLYQIALITITMPIINMRLIRYISKPNSVS